MLLKGALYVWKRYISLLTGNLRYSAHSVAHICEQEAENALGLFVVDFYGCPEICTGTFGSPGACHSPITMEERSQKSMLCASSSCQVEGFLPHRKYRSWLSGNCGETKKKTLVLWLHFDFMTFYRNIPQGCGHNFITKISELFQQLSAWPSGSYTRWVLQGLEESSKGNL